MKSVTKSVFLAALLGLASVSTFAGGNGCHNGCGGPGNSTNNNKAIGGQGGAGGQGVTFGVSFGTTWTDDNCDRRFDAIELRAQGLTLAATALMCQKENIRKAMKTAGTPCPEDNGQGNAAAGAPQAQVAQLPAAGNTAASSSANDHPAQSYSGNDPFVLARLGIVPLDSQR